MATIIGTIAQALVANVTTIAGTYAVAVKIGQAVELQEHNQVLVNFQDGSRLRFARGNCLTRFDRVGAEIDESSAVAVSSALSDMVRKAAINDMQPNNLGQAQVIIQTLRDENRKLHAGHRRYEILRKLNVVQFQALYTKSLQSPIPFDELVDMMGGNDAEC